MKKQIMALIAVSALTVSASAVAGDAAAGKAKAAVCAACHGNDGMGKMPTYPNLKGQKEVYMVKQLKAFRDGTRKDPTMNAMAKPLSDKDVDNLAAYYGGMK
ncbi:MAG: c-type cytochrome [Gammaproteobacteria bacterium]|nr:c-type cytochrome [Gammaproteobacteria bacterium]